MKTLKSCGSSLRVPGRLAGFLGIAIPAGVLLLAVTSVRAGDSRLNRGFNQDGNLLIADQFNNRVIEADKSGHIVWSYGLDRMTSHPTASLASTMPSGSARTR